MIGLCCSPILLFLLLNGLTRVADGFQSSFGLLNSRKLSQARGADDRSTRQPTSLCTLPKLIVFDLDNTLWSPELYQLRKLQRTNQTPVAGKDVKLLKGAKKALDAKRTFPETKFAVASRTKSVDWAHDLLVQFGIRDLFDHIEIFPGNKRAHFENIAAASGIRFREMLFFDDARDGRYGNCEPISQMGVLSVHCPNGLHSEDIFETGLKRFKEWDGSPNTIVEWNGEMTNSGVPTSNFGERHEGIVKMVNMEKGYGFIRYGDRNTRDVFFHFSSLPDNAVVEEGDKLSFQVEHDSNSGKDRATNIMIENSSFTSENKDTVRMLVFSMNMPFAALLANGYKTLETRNGTMFVPYPEGTKMLLHIGRRNYPDGNRHIDVMKNGGLEDEEIEELKSLPRGFEKGMAVAIVEIGKTNETAVEERSEPEFQRKVAAFGEDSGRMATEIKRVQYLTRPVKVSGQGGVFKADIDVDALPDGWTVPSSDVPYKTKEKSTSTPNESASLTGSKPNYSISG